MEWPKEITCHGNQLYPRMEPWHWREPKNVLADPDGWPHVTPWRTCSYCGSMHPEDLYNLATGNVAFVLPTHPEFDNWTGLRLEVADWKYGWPHKIYVEGLPRVHLDKDVMVGCRYNTVNGVETREPSYTKGVTLFAKFYNDHMADDGYDDEAWKALNDVLQRNAGLRFQRDANGKLMYRCGR